jgi:hypothetical protein
MRGGKQEMKTSSETNQLNEIKLILPHPPSVNHLYTTFRGRRIISAKGKKFKADIALLAARHENSTR